jgi:MFS family permease
MLGIAGINVAEVFLARESLDSGNVGLGILIGASGLGLTLGSLVGGPVLDSRGVRFTYAGSIAVMSVGYLAAAISPNVWVASAAVIVATAGNGVALVCNSTLVQRGAPDQLRGRAFTVIMSSNYALLGLGMALAGPLTSAVGGRWMWGVAGAIMAGGAGLSLALTRGVEVSTVSAEPDATEQVPAQAEPEPREAAAH